VRSTHSILEAATFFVQSEGQGGSPSGPRISSSNAAGKRKRQAAPRVARLPVPLWGSSKRQNGYEMKKIPENRKIFLHSLSLQILSAMCG
jgi:hypothetical protein